MENRAENCASCSFVGHFLKLDSPPSFSGNTTFKQQLALLSLAEKFPRTDQTNRVKGKINLQLQFDRSITLWPERWKIALKIAHRAFVSGISWKLTLRILSIFFGNTTFKQQLALLSLAESFQESGSRTNKTSYASNSVYFLCGNLTA